MTCCDRECAALPQRLGAARFSISSRILPLPAGEEAHRLASCGANLGASTTAPHLEASGLSRYTLLSGTLFVLCLKGPCRHLSSLPHWLCRGLYSCPSRTCLGNLGKPPSMLAAPDAICAPLPRAFCSSLARRDEAASISLLLPLLPKLDPIR